VADAGASLSEPRPLLAFAPAQEGPIPKSKTGSGFRSPVWSPSAARQGARLTPQFQMLQEALEQERAQLVGSTTTSDPEHVAVFALWQ